MVQQTITDLLDLPNGQLPMGIPTRVGKHSHLLQSGDVLVFSPQILEKGIVLSVHVDKQEQFRLFISFTRLLPEVYVEKRSTTEIDWFQQVRNFQDQYIEYIVKMTDETEIVHLLFKPNKNGLAEITLKAFGNLVSVRDKEKSHATPERNGEIIAKTLTIDGKCHIHDLKMILEEGVFITSTSIVGVNKFLVFVEGTKFEVNLQNAETTAKFYINEMAVVSNGEEQEDGNIKYKQIDQCTLLLNRQVEKFQLGSLERYPKEVVIKHITSKCVEVTLNGRKIQQEGALKSISLKSIFSADHAEENGMALLCPRKYLILNATWKLRMKCVYMESDEISMSSTLRLTMACIRKSSVLIRAGFASMDIACIGFDDCNSDGTLFPCPLMPNIEMPNILKLKTWQAWLQLGLGVLVRLLWYLAPYLMRFLPGSIAGYTAIKALPWAIGAGSAAFLSVKSVFSALWEMRKCSSGTLKNPCLWYKLVQPIIKVSYTFVGAKGFWDQRAVLFSCTEQTASNWSFAACKDYCKSITMKDVRDAAKGGMGKMRESFATCKEYCASLTMKDAQDAAKCGLAKMQELETWSQGANCVRTLLPWSTNRAGIVNMAFGSVTLGLDVNELYAVQAGFWSPNFAAHVSDTYIWDVRRGLKTGALTYDCTAVSLQSRLGNTFGGRWSQAGTFTVFDQHVTCHTVDDLLDQRRHSLWGTTYVRGENVMLRRCQLGRMDVDAKFICVEGSSSEFCALRGDVVLAPTRGSFGEVALSTPVLTQSQFDQWLAIAQNGVIRGALYLYAPEAMNLKFPRGIVFPIKLHVVAGGITLAQRTGFEPGKPSVGAAGGLYIRSLQQPFEIGEAHLEGQFHIHAPNIRMWDTTGNTKDAVIHADNDISRFRTSISDSGTLITNAENGQLNDHLTTTHAAEGNYMHSGGDNMEVDSKHSSGHEIYLVVDGKAIAVGDTAFDGANDVNLLYRHGCNEISIVDHSAPPVKKKKHRGLKRKDVTVYPEPRVLSPQYNSACGKVNFVNTGTEEFIKQSSQHFGQRGTMLDSSGNLRLQSTVVEQRIVKRKRFLGMRYKKREERTEIAVPCIFATGPGAISVYRAPEIWSRALFYQTTDSAVVFIADLFVIEKSTIRRSIAEHSLFGGIRFPMLDRFRNLALGKLSELVSNTAQYIRLLKKTDYPLETVLNAIVGWPDVASDINDALHAVAAIRDNDRSEARNRAISASKILCTPLVEVTINKKSKTTIREPCNDGQIEGGTVIVDSTEMRIRNGAVIDARNVSLKANKLVLEAGERRTRSDGLSTTAGLSLSMVYANQNETRVKRKTHQSSRIIAGHLHNEIGSRENRGCVIAAGSTSGHVDEDVQFTNTDTESRRSRTAGVSYNFVTNTFGASYDDSKSNLSMHGDEIRAKQHRFGASVDFAEAGSTVPYFESRKTIQTGKDTKSKGHAITVPVTNQFLMAPFNKIKKVKFEDLPLEEQLDNCLCANAIEMAYDYPEPASPTFQTELELMASRISDPVVAEKLKNLKVQPEWSTTSSLTFFEGNASDPERIIVAVAGTQSSTDVLKDCLIAGRQYDTLEYKKLIQLYVQLREKYPTTPMVVCGHSKGGTEAEMVGSTIKDDPNLKIASFNPGSGLPFGRTSKYENSGSTEVVRHVCDGDPVSLSADVALPSGENLRATTSKKVADSSHKLKNFTDRYKKAEKKLRKR